MKLSTKSACLFSLSFLVGAISLHYAAAADCRFQVSMVNNNRYVYESDEECPPRPSIPWGNWGVSSNVGSKQNGDRFQGWYSTSGHVQWNSCTDAYVKPDLDCERLNFPDYSLTYPYPQNGYPFTDPYSWNNEVPPYGSDRCVDQYSPNGRNTYGGGWIWLSAGYPFDLGCDGSFDWGGCKDFDGMHFTISDNYMTVYELDDLWGGATDDLVQTLYFPDVSVVLDCTVSTCYAVGDNNHDGWIDDVNDGSSAAYVWPVMYQDDWGVVCDPEDPWVPCKRIDATIRIGYIRGDYIGEWCDPSCDPCCLNPLC